MAIENHNHTNLIATFKNRAQVLGVENRILNPHVLHSNFSVIITMQVWPFETITAFLDSLVRHEFKMSTDRTPQFIAYKSTTTRVGVDYPSRRIVFQITDNNKNPHVNFFEMLSIIAETGYPSKESIERIDITGNITINVEEGRASSFVQSTIKEEFVMKVSELFNQPIRETGIRLSSEEEWNGDISNSPFLIMIEPLFTDVNNKKFAIALNLSTRSDEYAIKFIESLYDRLAKILMVMKGD